MPSINFQITATGPLVQLLIGVSLPRQQALIAAGQTVPTYVRGTFLVDTGASGTCIDPDLVSPLGLSPTSAVMIQTPSTAGNPVPCHQYDVALIIPGAQGQQAFVVEALPIIETQLKAQGIDGLLGRDVLNRCLLVYNSSLGFMTLSY